MTCSIRSMRQRQRTRSNEGCLNGAIFIFHLRCMRIMRTTLVLLCQLCSTHARERVFLLRTEMLSTRVKHVEKAHLPDDTVVVCSHGGCLMVLEAALTGTPPVLRSIVATAKQVHLHELQVFCGSPGL